MCANDKAPVPVFLMQCFKEIERRGEDKTHVGVSRDMNIFFFVFAKFVFASRRNTNLSAFFYRRRVQSSGCHGRVQECMKKYGD